MEYNGSRIFHITTSFGITPWLSLKIYSNNIMHTTRGIMPKVAITDEHMCLIWGEKKTWLFTNTATKITKCGHTDAKKQNFFVWNQNEWIHFIIIYMGNSISVQNFPFIVSLKKKKFDTL